MRADATRNAQLATRNPQRPEGRRSQPPEGHASFWWSDERQLRRVALNVLTRYLAIGIDLVIGLLILPFNVGHLGQTAYGLWMLAASVTIYFSVLELGYGGALVKFVAQYRALRDHEALNQLMSTMLVVFGACGLLAYVMAAGLALRIDGVFNLTPDQVPQGRALLLIIGLQVALYFPFSVYGALINGFQRYDLNSAVSIATSFVVAAVNVAVLSAGFGLIELVAATTSVRIGAYFVYRLNAYRVFPGLRLRLSSFRRERIGELTSFSVYMVVLDWARRLNYASDPVVIGIFLNSAAVAVWTVAQRLAHAAQRFTNQVNGVLFPVVVDCDAARRTDRLRQILVQGTRFSLAMVVPIAVALALLADPLIGRWVGPGFEGSVVLTQVLAMVVLIRVGDSTATTVLKGAGAHRMLAITNLATGVVNIALSVALIGPYGLTGVAVATLVSIGGASTFVLFPAACRRVRMSCWRGFAEAVWPALWPGAVVAGLLAVTRQVAGGTLMAVAWQSALAGVVYLTVFYALAIDRDERRLYRTKTRELLKWRPGLPVAA